MNETARRERNTVRLAECWPAFGAAVGWIIARLEYDGFRPRIQDGYRTPADQLAAQQAGRSKLAFGFHNVTAVDGKPESLAVDLIDDDHPLASSAAYCVALAAAAAHVGCQTGILWGLPDPLKVPVRTAIRTRDVPDRLKLGWDPTHIEPLGITPDAARKGRRPVLPALPSLPETP